MIILRWLVASGMPNEPQGVTLESNKATDSIGVTNVGRRASHLSDFQRQLGLKTSGMARANLVETIISFKLCVVDLLDCLVVLETV